MCGTSAKRSAMRQIDRPPHPGLDLIGEDWEEKDLPAMYPKLWEAFG